ncbi:MAG: hypothetical protein HZB57_00375 [Gammaproteobacteria bacterium]|nr:hypothetical protein [Gammaproteobacteria bacterium]
MKPTLEELHQALTEAQRLRAAGEDTQHLAKTVLYQQERLRYLEDVYLRAERLVQFGLDEHEHALLVKALDAARRAEEAASKSAETLGLG